MEPTYTKETPQTADSSTAVEDTHYDEELTPPANDGQRKAGVVVGLVVLIAVLFAVGLIPRLIGRKSEAATVTALPSANVSVSVIPVAAPAAEDTIELPGNVEAIDQTAVVARAGGYVKKWFADIGDRVSAGQTLAIIDTPDLDQQLAQAQAQVASAQANEVQMLANLSSLRAKLAEGKANVSRARASLDQSRTDLERAKVEVAHGQEAVARQQAQLDQAQAAYDLAKVTSDRYQGMLADGAVDQESADQALASYKSSASNVSALKAALRAAKEDVNADKDAVLSAQANVTAYESALKSSQADVASDEANISSGAAVVQAALANIRSNEDNVARIKVLQSFNRVTAPFSGVVTARNIDTGTLISASGAASGTSAGVGSSVAGAGSAGGAASGSSSNGAGSSSGGQSSLYTIARTDQLRVYINVPQAFVDDMKVGQPASVTVSAVPGKTFAGKVARTSNALDPVSRTLVTEVHVDNSSDLLRPGMFANIKLQVPHPAGSVLIPDAALVTNGQGTTVELVDNAGNVHFQPVSIGRDFGKVMEITSGLTPGQRIVASTNDGLREGQHVDIAAVESAPQSSGG